MPHVTTQLGNEPGIQHQGVKDASSAVNQFPVVGLFTGSFRRGRLDKPMVVNLRNIRALLGHDVKNPDYLAVLNALEDGAPNVQVLRLKQQVEISCDGAWTYAELSFLYQDWNSVELKIEILVNGQNYTYTGKYGDGLDPNEIQDETNVNIFFGCGGSILISNTINQQSRITIENIYEHKHEHELHASENVLVDGYTYRFCLDGAY